VIIVFAQYLWRWSPALLCEFCFCLSFFGPTTGHKLKNEFIVQCEEMRQIIMRSGPPLGSTAVAAVVDPLHDRQLLLSMIQELEGKITAANQCGGAHNPTLSEIHQLRTELDAEMHNRLKFERRHVW
jgi:hypothetical protein